MEIVKRLRKSAALRGRKGVSTVEAAIIFGLLLLLTMGIIEYGWFLFKNQQITNAARHGARVAARPRATNAEVTAAIAQLMHAADISGYQVTMPTDISTVPAKQTLTVTVSVPYANVQLAGPPFVPLPQSIRADVTMAKEGP